MMTTGESRLLQFLPWCAAAEPIEVGEIALVPHRVGVSDACVNAADTEVVRTILRPYVGVSCEPKPEQGDNVVELFPGCAMSS